MREAWRRQRRQHPGDGGVAAAAAAAAECVGGEELEARAVGEEGTYVRCVTCVLSLCGDASVASVWQ